MNNIILASIITADLCKTAKCITGNDSTGCHASFIKRKVENITEQQSIQ